MNPRTHLAVGALLVMAGCDAFERGRSQRALVPLPDCDAAIDHVRQVALERMNQHIDERIASYAAGESCGRGAAGGGDDAAGGGARPTPDAPSSDGSGPSGGSETNNQVAGIDEADFVKRDGELVYLAQNGVLRILDAWPAEQTHEVSVTPLDGAPRKMFVEAGRALVYVARPVEPETEWGYGGGECTYGYDCDFVGDGSATAMLVFDVRDPAAPVLVREVELSGSLIAARRIGGAIHTVVNDNTSPFPELALYPEVDLCAYLYDDPDADWDAPPPADWIEMATEAYEALRASNAALIASKDLSGLLPTMRDSAAPGTTDLCGSLYASSVTDGASFTTIVSLALEDERAPTTATIVSRAGAVYASAESLYLAVGHLWESDDVSHVHRFAISDDPAATGYAASGVVPGRALNQFAMDERDGRLRIATTSGRVPDPDVSSQLSVLAPYGDALAVIGQVDGIAPTEDIRSVRFDGDRAFIVTFKKTDPLFVLDLSNPVAPAVLGELKIPGFSTYMHMLDEDHLLTIGYDADDHGDFAYFDGVLLQIFDVSDPHAPTLAHQHVIGTRGSSSEALTNHLAFTYYAEESVLAVPMTVCEGGGDGAYGGELTFSGLMVFDVDAGDGIGERGRVAHPVPDEVTCDTWWTQASSAVERSLFLEDFVYSISSADLRVQSIDDLGTDLAVVPLDEG